MDKERRSETRGKVNTNKIRRGENCNMERVITNKGVCIRSGVMQSETVLKNPAGNKSWQPEGDLKSCIMFCRFLSLIGSKCVMVLELVLGGHMYNTPPVPGTVALTLI